MKKEVVSFEGVRCANCGAPMQGEFCHECGQSIHTVLRPMHHMVEDTLDMVLHIDGRVVHTIPPLFLRPGFLTLEYFSGRRQRYVAPFRLMFVLCLLAFFVCHLAVDNLPFIHVNVVGTGNGDFAKDATPEAVRAHYQQLTQASDEQLAGRALHGDERAKQLAARRNQANHRLVQLGASPLERQGETENDFQGMAQPIHVGWLPDGANAALNRTARHMVSNLKQASEDGSQGSEAREHLVAATFGVLPQTMFVVMPLFALLLKIVYLFKRRLYMEHLIVALHSHAFLFLALMLGVLLGMLRGWLAPHAAWLRPPLSLAIWALAIWMPLYLLLMQKRIYRQGWLMTTLKYLFVGWCYVFLMSVALVAAVALGLTH